VVEDLTDDQSDFGCLCAAGGQAGGQRPEIWRMSRAEVVDDRPGIPEALQPRVFEPFYRTGSRRKPDSGSAGIGLTTFGTVAVDPVGGVER